MNNLKKISFLIIYLIKFCYLFIILFAINKVEDYLILFMSNYFVFSAIHYLFKDCLIFFPDNFFKNFLQINHLIFKMKFDCHKFHSNSHFCLLISANNYLKKLFGLYFKLFLNRLFLKLFCHFYSYFNLQNHYFLIMIFIDHYYLLFIIKFKAIFFMLLINFSYY